MNPAHDPELTIAICTHNRRPYLEKALASLATQTLGSSRFETLIVDNASSDDTASAVRRFAEGNAGVRYVYEGKLGLSNARNRAIAEARGNLLAFLDDDAIASPQWSESILRAFDTVDPTPGCVGGKTLPIWEVPRPNWLPNELLGFLTVVDWAAEPMFLDLDRYYVAGANMAFPTALLREVGGFDPRLGRVGKNLVSGEELHVLRSIERKGHPIYYDPRVAVDHHVPAARLEQKWFYRRVFAEGYSAAVMTGSVAARSRFARVGAALAQIGQLLSEPRDVASLLLPASTSRRFARRCQALQRLGRAWGYVAG